jgi:iron complex outermembrane receptor protein
MRLSRMLKCAGYAAPLLLAAPAAAQRANENVLKSAEDAFGNSVGNERVGLYNPNSARGFSPSAAGNVRIEGLYFDLQAPFSDRLVGSSTMRVGLTAQGYPFVAPTGIADFTLRKPGDEAVLSTAATANSFGGVRLEVDAALPVTSRLGLAGGVSYEREQLHYGEDRNIAQAAIVARWRPSDAVEIVPFWSLYDSTGQEAQRVVFTTGSFLPRVIERRHLLSPGWSDNEARWINYGLLGTARAGAWALRFGLFRSLALNDWSYSDLQLNTGLDGSGDRFIIAEPNRTFGSVSGELRASRLFTDGERRHSLLLTARGRAQNRRYGGGQTIGFGRFGLEEVLDAPRPDFTFGPQSRDRVRQKTLGIGYQGLWPGVGELSLGLQRSWYRKSGETPSAPIPVSKDSPWLMNGTVSVHAASRLVLYAGYAKGLEESPIAPPNAVNRDEAPPAIITEQMDAGFRYAFTDNLRLVAGLFDVRKPYFGLDNGQVYRNLGQLRNRGVEMSLSGRPVPELSLVLGLLLLDSRISGDAVDQGLVGRRPVDSFGRYGSAGIEYNPAGLKGLSFDIRYENYSSRVADRRNSFVIPGRHVLSLGGRYRFRLGGAPATLRVQAASITDDFTWAVFGEGFFYNIPRRLIVSLTADW